jgi:phosphoribosyl-ATP pyrophosphohydrolase/phosphoribosyl-AMP cyclohydrolase
MTKALSFLGQLEQVIADRRKAPPETSYTASLLQADSHRLAQKIGEEGVELALAGVGDDPERIVAEAADLLYHVLVLLAKNQLSLSDVVAELERRHTR